MIRLFCLIFSHWDGPEKVRYIRVLNRIVLTFFFCFHSSFFLLIKMLSTICRGMCSCCLLIAIVVLCKISVISMLNTTYTLDYDEGLPGVNRTARFWFDAIFRIGTGLGSALEYEEEEAAAETHVKTCDCDCGFSNEEIRIVGGKPTGVNQYPWMARIVYDGKFHCGGSLLTKDYVITAAHCVKKLRRSKIRVIFGDHDQHITTESKAIQRAVTAIVKHRSFDPETYNNDIALLRLRKPITFSKIMKPICLPRHNYDPAGRVGTVVGWGRTSEGGELPAIVNQVKVPILTITECRNQKYKSSRITSGMLCAGRPQMDSCQGDSGGPLLLSNGVKFYIVGIVSWGVGCGRDGYPGVYTRVSKFIPWIKANLDNTCLCT